MKCVTCLCLSLVLLGAVALPAGAAGKSGPEPGGPAAFFIGCLLGLRAGLEYNEGATPHWREWARFGGLVPVVGWVLGPAFAIWDGIECNEGMTAHEWAEKYGADWY